METVVKRVRQVRLVWWLVVAGVLRLGLFGVGFHGDVLSNLDWGARFWEYGPYRIYENQFWALVHPNQPPGYFYLFAILHKIYEGAFNLVWWVNVNVSVFPSGLVGWTKDWLPIILAKVPGLIGDLGLGYLIYSLGSRFWTKEKAKVVAGIWLFNPAVIYVSAVWGQIDSWVMWLTLSGLVLLTRKKFVWGSLVLALAYYTKLSLAMFLPVILMVWYQVSGKWVSKLMGLSVGLAVLGILSLPFADRPVWWFLVYVYQVRVLGFQVPWMTVNAFNFWGMVLGLNPIAYNRLFWGLSGYRWGVMGFTLSVLPLIRFVRGKWDWPKLTFGLTILALSMFLFFPGMHERYLLPVLPVLVILVGWGLVSKWWYVLVSLIYLVNLYRLWWFPYVGLVVRWLSDGNGLGARLLSGVNVIFLIYLWSRSYPRLVRMAKKEKNEI